MKKIMKTITYFAVVLCFVLQPFIGSVASAASLFSDIKEHWAKGYIELLAERDIVHGYKNGTFLPNNALTKAEAATLICSAAGIQPSETVSTPLTDIKGHWGQKYISVLPVVVAPNNQFSPETKITRADFAEMVVGAMYLDVSKTDTSGLKKKFKDWGAIPQEAMPYITVAVSKGIISGYQDSTFRPDRTLTRAEACVILKKAFFPDLQMKPSQYYVDTVADVENVTSMAVATDNTLYYVDNNTVYHVVNGKSEPVLTGNISEPLSFSTADVLKLGLEAQFSNTSVEFSLKNVKDQLETNTEVEFTDLTIVGVSCDPVTGKTYALMWSVIPEYSYRGDLYMMALFDVDLSTEPAIIFTASHYSSSSYTGMPEYVYSIYNNQVFYSPGFTCILRWNITTGKMTLVASNIYDYSDNILFADDVPYRVYSGDDVILNLINEKNIKINGLEDNSVYFRSNFWNHNYYVGQEFYPENGGIDSRIYRISLPDKNVSKVNAEVIVDASEVESKDGLPFRCSGMQLWTPDAEGTLYFHDTNNNIIRKLYGVP